MDSGRSRYIICERTSRAEAEAKRLASSMGAECYVESSSLTQKNLKEVFDQGGCSAMY